MTIIHITLFTTTIDIIDYVNRIGFCSCELWWLTTNIEKETRSTAVHLLNNNSKTKVVTRLENNLFQ